MTNRRWITGIGLLSLLAPAMLSSACGYALAGRSNTLPVYIKRIGVPDCVNQSGQPDVDRVMSDALRVEFSGRGKFTVLPQATDVDGLLKCTITSLQLQTQDVNQQHQAVAYNVVVTANVEFYDVYSGNKLYWANPAVQFSEPFTLTNGQLTADATNILRQDADAVGRLAHSFAKSIVTSVLEAF